MMKNFTLDVILHVGFGVQTDTQTNPDNGFVKNARGFLEYNPFNPLLLLFCKYMDAHLSTHAYLLITGPKCQKTIV